MEVTTNALLVNHGRGLPAHLCGSGRQRAPLPALLQRHAPTPPGMCLPAANCLPCWARAWEASPARPPHHARTALSCFTDLSASCSSSQAEAGQGVQHRRPPRRSAQSVLTLVRAGCRWTRTRRPGGAMRAAWCWPSAQLCWARHAHAWPLVHRAQLRRTHKRLYLQTAQLLLVRSLPQSVLFQSGTAALVPGLRPGR